MVKYGIPGKYILALVIISAVLSSQQKSAWAEEPTGVPASYAINYDVLSSGETRVRIDGKLYNPKQDVYISEYSILLSLNDAYNVEASDSRGKLYPDIERLGKQTRISFKFNERVVGTERPLSFILSYSTATIARKRGLVWEVNIPKASDYRFIREYNVILSIPNSLGPQIYASPEPNSIEKTKAGKIYKFDTSTISKTGAILSFGPYQIYSFELKYHLSNKNLFPGTAKVAIPPSIIAEQQVSFERMYPPPINIEVDPDGNYLATYNLAAGKTTLVTVGGKAKILNPIRNINTGGLFYEIPNELKVYTKPLKYWESDNEKIASLVKEVVGDISQKSNVSEIALKLYNYTTKTLSYDEARVKPDLNRFGGLKALESRGSAVCMEFADLLITLLRASGIPAQLLEGYAYTTDAINRPAIGDVLHSWVRVYIPRLGWVAVDPTWGNTTGGLDYFSHLDTNHFIFAVKGHDSETPYPAGAYKISPDQVGDINVNIADNQIDIESKPSITLISKKLVTLFNRVKGIRLEIKNSGSETVYNAKIAFRPGTTTHSSDKTINLGDIPPYAGAVMDLSTDKIPPLNSLLADISYTNFEGVVKTDQLTYVESKDNNANSRLTPTVIGIFVALLLYSCVVFLLRKRPDLLR